MAQTGPWLRGDAESRFDRLYESHYQAIYAYALRRTRATHEVPDLVAEVFTTAWRRMATVPKPPEDMLWLYGVARRVVSQHHRGHRRRDRLDVRLRGTSMAPEAPESASDNSSHLRLTGLIDALSPRDREVVRLIAWEQLDHAQVAYLLGCTPNAVAIRWHRSVKFLRDHFDDAVADSAESPQVCLDALRIQEM
jgi:RNA polymerase sigma factor (sigma-70 family)